MTWKGKEMATKAQMQEIMEDMHRENQILRRENNNLKEEVSVTGYRCRRLEGLLEEVVKNDGCLSRAIENISKMNLEERWSRDAGNVFRQLSEAREKADEIAGGKKMG